MSLQVFGTPSPQGSTLTAALRQVEGLVSHLLGHLTELAAHGKVCSPGEAPGKLRLCATGRHIKLQDFQCLMAYFSASSCGQLHMPFPESQVFKLAYQEHSPVVA